MSAKPMRILSIHMNSSINGGAEVVYSNGNRLLAEMGHQVAWLTIGQPPEALRHGQVVFTLPEIPAGKTQVLSKAIFHFYNSESVRLAQRAIREFRPDIVHLHTIFGYRHLSPSVLLPFRKNGIPIVQTLHDYGLLCPASFFLSQGKICESCKGGKYRFAASKRCMGGTLVRSGLAALMAYFKDYFYHYDALIAGYIAPSRFLHQKFIEFGYSPRKMEVIPNAFFSSETTQPAPGDKRRDYLLFAGRLSHEKGVDILIRAAAGLDIPVKIAGDGAEKISLQALANNLHLHNIEFLGEQPHQAMSILYRDAAFTIMPSRWYENGPLVILESFSHATAVIAARIGAMPEFVKEGQTGFLFNANEPDDLRRVIRAALKRPDYAETLEKNAYHYVQTEHAPDIYGTRLENALQKHISD